MAVAPIFRSSSKHKRMHRCFRYAIFGLTGVSTVLAGVSLKFPDWNTSLSLGILIVTAIIALVASIDGVRKPGELWIHERATLYQLKDIRRAVGFRLANPEGSKSLDDYFELMQAVLGTAGDKWQRQIVTAGKEPSPPKASPLKTSPP